MNENDDSLKSYFGKKKDKKKKAKAKQYK